jgi:hypothetical protein
VLRRTAPSAGGARLPEAEPGRDHGLAPEVERGRGVTAEAHRDRARRRRSSGASAAASRPAARALGRATRVGKTNAPTSRLAATKYIQRIATARASIRERPYSGPFSVKV